MIFLVYSETNEESVIDRLGKPEYSYYYVRKAYTPLLEALGQVITIRDPELEVDPIYLAATSTGEECIFLSFSPPHRTTMDLSCPTIPIFAWEFDSVPTETWYGERQQDWRYAFENFGRAITHSEFAVSVVKKSMGRNFPIASIPAPVWDNYSRYDNWKDHAGNPIHGPVESDRVLDTSQDGWEQFRYISIEDDATETYQPISIPRQPAIDLDGIVYTSVLNPDDRRKNVVEMIRAFCWALKDRSDAILVVKLISAKWRAAIKRLSLEIYRMAPFDCRIILIGGHLEDHAYETLVERTTYIVNISSGEGQCLPLMEYMSAGRPAIAPCHTAMQEYVSDGNSFLVESSLMAQAWPHDPRGAIRTRSHQVDLRSVVKAFCDSYLVARADPSRYYKMAENSRASLKAYCKSEELMKRLKTFLTTPTPKLSEIQIFGWAMKPNGEYLYGSIPQRSVEIPLTFGTKSTDI